MKKNRFLLFNMLLLVACNNNKADEPVPEENTTAEVFSWQAVLNDSTGNLELRKRESAGPDSLAPEAVVRFVNASFPNIVLQLVKTSHDTLFLKIPDAHYLTQQMGSTGPELYFAEAVYNFTEIPGIRFVNFDFEEGDHAQPDTFSRDSFKKE
jgi:hypothetical protein